MSREEKDKTTAAPFAAFSKDEKKVEPLQSPSGLPSVFAQEQMLAQRDVAWLSDEAILHGRFGFAVGANPAWENCRTLFFRESGERAGVVPMIPLNLAWKKAHHNAPAGTEYDITQSEFNAAAKKIEEYLKQTRKISEVCLNDVWEMSEFEFMQLFLFKAERVIGVLRGAILSDIAESRALEARWRKIKRYSHKVALDYSVLGFTIFTPDEIRMLSLNGIRKLNDLRKRSIYDLKNILPGHDFEFLPEQINAAFKEEYERRKDFRFKLWPYIVGSLALCGLIVVGYLFQYTLIKNVPMTAVVGLLISVYLLSVGAIVWGVLRARRRRKKMRPNYVYFSKSVRWTFSVVALAALFSLGSVTFFYERYDDYDDVLYYRYLSKEEIAVAGLVNDGKHVENGEKYYDTQLAIPENYAGRTVVEIDLYSFRNNRFESVSIPDTVTEIDKYAFVGCSELRSVILPENLESISPATFKNCTSLETVSFGANVTEIGKNAFAGCASLKAVSLPKGVASIGASAFAGCSSMESFVCAGGIESVGKAAFKDCAALRTATLADSTKLSEIPDDLFHNCAALEKTDFFDNAVKIGSNALRGCASLTSFTLRDDVESIGKKVFYGCNSLVGLTVPYIGKTVDKPSGRSYLLDSDTRVQRLTVTKATSVAKRAFADMGYLEIVTLRGDVTEIGAYAFEGCSMLLSVEIPVSITTLPDGLFSDCGSLTTVRGGAVTEFGDKTFMNCVSLTAVPFAVERVGKSCFAGCVALTDVSKLSDTLYFGDSAFEDCASLTAFTMNKNAETVGKHLFNGCTALDALEIPYIGKTAKNPNSFSYLFDGTTPLRALTVTNATAIASSAFKDASHLETVYLNDEITKIGKNAFEGCTRLTDVHLPDGITGIENSMFENCRLLVSVSASSVTTLGDSAFNGCSALKSVSFPAVVKIGKNCFQYCRSLYHTGSMDSLETIGSYAFNECATLPAFALADTVTSIGEGAFSGCSSVTMFDLSHLELKTFGSCMFMQCSALETVYLPLTITEIPAQTFSGCTSLGGFGIPSYITAIGDGAFENCYLDAIGMPDTLLTIGKEAFKGNSFTNLQIPDSVKKIGRNAFSECNSLTAVVTPFLGKSRTSTSNGYQYLFGVTKTTGYWGTVSYTGSCVESVTLTDMKKLSVKTFDGGEETLRAVYLSEGIKKIPNGIFRDFTVLRTVVLSESVTKIADNAFRGCTNLTSVTMPDSVGWIGRNAFRDCTNLSSIKLPASLDRITRHSFRNSGLTSVFIPTGIKKIERNAFRGCSSLLTVDFGAATNLKKIERHAFRECRNLTDVYLINSSELTKIERNAFRDCSSITTVNLSGATSLSKVENNAFRGCSKLTTLTFSSNIKRIEAGSFRDCTALTSVFVPDSVKTIGGSIFNFAFRGCTRLRSVSIPASLTKYSRYFPNGASTR